MCIPPEMHVCFIIASVRNGFVHVIWAIWRLVAKSFLTMTWTSCSLKSPVISRFVWQLMRTHIKEISKSALLVFCEGNSPVTGEFPAQRASNAEKASILWGHRALCIKTGQNGESLQRDWPYWFSTPINKPVKFYQVRMCRITIFTMMYSILYLQMQVVPDIVITCHTWHCVQSL